MALVLHQILDKPVPAGMYSTPTTVFRWSIEGSPMTDAKGQFVRVGSYLANCWFHVSVGKDIKQTFANVRRRLQASMKRCGATGCFELVEE